MTPTHPSPGELDRSPGSARLGLVPKLVGTDMELGNFIEIPGVERETSRAAARLLLAEISGIPARRIVGAVRGRGDAPAEASCAEVTEDPQDWGRRFLTSGAAAYIDLDHLELCSAETTDVLEHVAGVLALFRLARRAGEAAQAKLPSAWRMHVLANNSDGRGSSWGSHLNFLISRSAYDRVFNRRLHHLVWLATYQASSILFTGQGKVGGENGRPSVDFQLSQRADFFESLLGWQTTYRRPIVNSRDEPLCGEWREDSSGAGMSLRFARLHSIFFDHTLCQVATFLKVGVMQIVLAMLEAGWVNMGVLLADPVQAVQEWSRDLGFEARAETCSGKRLSALEVQEILCHEAREFVDAGHCEGIVPRAHDILRCWEETLALLRARDLDALARRLDWARKYLLLERAVTTSGCAWDAPAIKRLDHQWGNLDPDLGLYWACERAGLQEAIVTEQQIRRRETAPPEDSRAWARSLLLLAAGPDEIESVDWDGIRFRLRDRLYPELARHYWVSLANPLGHTRAELDGVGPASGSLRDLLPVCGAIATAGTSLVRRSNERPGAGSDQAPGERAHPGTGARGVTDRDRPSTDDPSIDPESTR